MATTLSVIVPVFNEEEVLPTFYERLSASLATLPCQAEMLFVNDGSSDRTAAILEEWVANDERVRVLSFTRNFGHQAALGAGLDHCSGDAVVLIDADLQDPPELIPQLYAKWLDGYQVVFGRRRRLEEGFLKRNVYHLFYRLLNLLAHIEIPLDSGDFSLLDRQVVDRLCRLPERTRFLRGLRSWIGCRQIGIEYDRPVRHAGRSKYSLAKLFQLALDGILSFSTVPLRLALVLGLLVSLVGFAGIGLVTYLRLTQSYDLPGWGSLMVIVLFLGGVQLTTIGIVGEYIARIYEEVKFRPLYLVADRIGFPEPAAGRTSTVSAGADPGRAPRPLHQP
jgi:dolichol-phosphate mannosyltransferase